MKRLIMTALVVLPACAPLPGPGLFPELSHPTPIEQVKVTTTIAPFMTSVYCNKAAWECGKRVFVVANLLLNGGFVLGCSTVRWDENGDVVDCDVYVAFDWGWIIEHEMLHCQGYADGLY